MDKNAVVVGMKVVPHSKTRGTPWDFVFDGDDGPTELFFKDNGYLFVVQSIDNGDSQLARSLDAPAYWFHASDFEPYEATP